MAIFSTLGSHRRMLSIVTWSACSAAAGRRSAAAYSVVATWSSANALRVASRLRWMYGSSRCSSWGATWKRCTIVGNTPPTRIDDSQNSTRPLTGSTNPREQHHQPKRRELRVHVGVGGAGHHPAGREHQRELVQPVAPGLEQQRKAKQ